MEKPYRNCVVAVIHNEAGLILAGERSDAAGSWQMPQGGIDPGETAEQALLRELREEIGTDQLRILRQVPEPIRYEFPAGLDTGPAKKYRGQQQVWFLLQLDPGAVPDLAKSDGEFQGLQWLSPGDLLHGIVPWKREAYRCGLEALGLV